MPWRSCAVYRCRCRCRSVLLYTLYSNLNRRATGIKPPPRSFVAPVSRPGVLCVFGIRLLAVVVVVDDDGSGGGSGAAEKNIYIKKRRKKKNSLIPMGAFFL